MVKRKLQRFSELESMERVYQFPFPLLEETSVFKGKWGSDIFKNEHPLILELGCGRGEYTLELARRYPGKNFIGIDIKGARIWKGGKTINEENILNAAFVRIKIEWLGMIFDKQEADEIWITFPDPQPQASRENRRITSNRFLDLYRMVLKPGGIVHLKTDNEGLFTYTKELLEQRAGELLAVTEDLYHDKPEGEDLSIQTTYEKIFLKEKKPIRYLKFRFPFETDND